jgi:RecA/RadA recombinase
MADEKTTAPEKAPKETKPKRDYSRLAVLKGAMLAINKEHGKATIGVGSAMRPAAMARISSGSLAWDFASGGGIPVGRVTLIYGKKSSGKSSRSQRAMGIAQNRCANCLRPPKDFRVVQVTDDIYDPKTGEVVTPGEWAAQGTCDCMDAGLFTPRRLEIALENNQTRLETDTEFGARCKALRANSFEELRVALIDVEGAFDRAWATNLGLDSRRLLYVCPPTAEEAIDIYEALIRTGAVDLICLDSIAALTPAIEVEKSTEDEQRAALAKLVNKFVRLDNAATNDVNRLTGRLVTRIWVTQPRTKMNVTFGDDEVLPGGMGQEFAASMIVKSWSSSWEAENALDDVKKEDQIKLGTTARMNFFFKYNKTAPARGTGSEEWILAGPEAGRINEDAFICNLAERYHYWGKTDDDKQWFLKNLPWQAPKEVTRYPTKTKAVEALLARDHADALRERLLAHMHGAVARGEAV